MKISIITVAFNAEKTIGDTIESVLKQDYEDIEYIIIDGASTDQTLDVINQYKSQIDTIISEPDQGIYDGMNKGISYATGDFVGILNADDFYTDHTVVSRIVEQIQKAKANAIYADLKYVDAEDPLKVKRKWVSGEFKREKFINGWMPPHPTFFLQRTLYEKYGGYSLDLKSAADYELMLRMLLRHKVPTTYLNAFIISMRVGGVSNASVKNRVNANREDRKAWEMNNLKPRFYTILMKPLRKIGQFLVKK